MRSILLINPSIKNTIFGKMKTLALPPMGLGTLAALTPPDFKVTIVDENVEDLDFSAHADLVGVTSTTVQAPRAYEIMRRFRERGIPTVLGGIHASVCTEEAMNHADAVVEGEADDLWPEVVQDFAAGKLQKTYRAAAFPCLAGRAPVDRSLFSPRYVIQSVQTSRGCPCNCNFCSVTNFNGRRYRYRPVPEVLQEVRALKDNRFFISDDSVVGLGKENLAHAKELFQGLRGMGKSWGSQVCITIAEHEDLLRAASLAGANTFYIGFESVEEESLRAMDKGVNLRPAIRNFKDAIHRMHDHGIGVIGGFILGGDGDTPDIFKRTVEFIHETAIDGCQFTVMTPFPGTRFYDRMLKEGRLLYTDYPNDWARYNAYEVVIKPNNMSIDELKRGQQYVYDATSTIRKSIVRGVKTLINTRSVINAVTNVSWNYYNYRAIKQIA